ncbi:MULTISPECIES: class F sortase [unclassified Streptomyces]|uniref:class F sortase n=1 Tax=unclassified Streptomyces TaxID=2593676 RepID=UPI0016611C13|nr:MULTISPECIES: class F sortase [unclassified Streptomyces]MBD0708066.1 class F sortase [Streptomyces sp. CBMA291]MBD0715840.1 class F sortase [Streptomyces sp. CBMA370]
MSNRSKGWGLAVAACVGLWLVQNGSEQVTPPVPSAAQAFAAGPSVHTDAAADPLPPSPPVRLRIPETDVDTPLTPLGLSAGGSLDVPPAGNRNLAGWYRDGTAPGAKGTAIVAGHVDNAEGPAVFYTLGALRKGHRVEVDRRDGRTAVFTIDAVEVYANEDFPDRRVYDEADRAEIRLITCGGGFSKKNGYQGNVVAFGHLIGVR